MTICSRTVGYCFPYCFSYCFLEIIVICNSETEYRNANTFSEQVVQILKKWAPSRHVTFKFPPGVQAKYGTTNGIM